MMNQTGSSAPDFTDDEIHRHLAVWRNWQTRLIQNQVGVFPWRFESSHRYFHKTSRKPGRNQKLVSSLYLDLHPNRFRL